MSPLCVEIPKLHRQDTFPAGGVVVVQSAKPAQVIVQITCGNAVKAVDPLLEAVVIGVDVLDMDGAPDAHTRAQVDGLV